MIKSQVKRGVKVVVFYGVGFHSDLNAHKRYNNIYLLNNLAIFETSESAAIAVLNTVMDYQEYILPLEKFNAVFNFNIK